MLAEVDTATSAWTVASGNYSSRFSGVGAGAVAGRGAQAARRRSTRSASTLGDPELSLRRVAGLAHWHPDALPEGMEPGLHATAFYAPPNLAPPDDLDRVASSAAHGFIVDVAVVEVDRETGAVTVLDYITVHDAGRLLNPLLADGQVEAASRTAPPSRCSSATCTTSGAIS